MHFESLGRKDAVMNKVLFLCTRNICSSRVAEALFNHYAGQWVGRINDPSDRQLQSKKSVQRLPGWQADSRGFEVGTNSGSSLPDESNPVSFVASFVASSNTLASSSSPNDLSSANSPIRRPSENRLTSSQRCADAALSKIELSNIETRFGSGLAMSENAIDYLHSQQIQVAPFRMPMAVEPCDLLWADRIIALFEEEHRPIVEAQYSQWTNRVEYWNVPDFHESNWGKALTKLEANVSELVSVIRSSQPVIV